MERRNIFKAILVAAAGLATPSRAVTAQESNRMRVVYHLSDLEKVAFVLSNMENHVRGVGGPGVADIRVVVHGPALKAFHAKSADPTTSDASDGLMKLQVGFDACANTMRAQNVKLEDLLPGFGVADKGGVVRLTELQMQGYAYLRP
jgi:intracellular sulfur oxidation DsrE/DsrF family protein